MAKQEFGPGKEFFSEWHRDRHIEDLRRDHEAAKLRVADLEALGVDPKEPGLRDALSQVESSKAELTRLGWKWDEPAKKKAAKK